MVYDTKVNMLQEEKIPLADLLTDMEKNEKMIFKELLDEANDQSRIKSKIQESNA